ncbi:MAG: uncharacterized protein KVP18_000786 [Porospora cf. gigantea A]|nr:MAG: hypothetical protein KVP18_000786 [Porospora cf. gigantea A]
MCFPYLHSVAAYLGVWEYKMPPPRGYFDGVYCTSIEASRLQQGQQSYRIAKYRTHRDVTMSMVKAMAAGELLNDIQLPDDRVSLDQFKALLPDVHSDSLQEVVLRLAWRVIRQNSSAQYLSSLPKDQIRRMNARILEDGPSGVVHLADLLVTRRFRVMDQVAARQQIQEVALTSKTHLEPHSLRQQIFRCREESTSQPHFPSSRCRRFSRRN